MLYKQKVLGLKLNVPTCLCHISAGFGEDRQIPRAPWPASLAEWLNSRTMINLVSKRKLRSDRKITDVNIWNPHVQVPTHNHMNLVYNIHVHACTQAYPVESMFLAQSS